MNEQNRPTNAGGTQISRHHHYVPQFYSKQWCGADGRLCEFSRPHRETVPKRKHPSATGFQLNLYSVPGATRIAWSYIEDHFLKLSDQRANDALQYLLTDRLSEMDGDSRSGWARFMMSQLQRTPQKVAWLLNSWNERYQPKLDQGEYEKIRRPEDPSTIEEYLEKNTDRLRAIGATQLLQAVMDLPRFGDHLVGMEWTVGTFQNYRHDLLTSDRPVIVSNGMLKPDSFVIVPIAPDRLFVAANNEILAKRMAADDPQLVISRCNDLVARQAHTYVYGRNDAQLRFVENRLGRGTPQLITSRLPNVNSDNGASRSR